MSPQQHSVKTNKSETLLFIFRRLMFKETILPPSVFFTFILLQELDLLKFPTKVSLLFFTGIAFFVLTLYNHYFYFSSTLNINLGSFIPINFILGILGCNQKSKFLLFCFSCFYYLPLPHIQIQELSVIIISLIICYLTFEEMIFLSHKQNKWFFTGFFALSCLRFSSYVLYFAFNVQFSLIQKICIVPVSIFLGFAIFKIRIRKAMRFHIKQIKNPYVLLQYIKIHEESFKKPENISSYLYNHKQTCLNTSCYCTQYPEKTLMNMNFDKNSPISKEIIDNIFIESFENNNWSEEDRYFLMHRYVEFLMNQKQYIRSVNFLSHMQETEMGYFNKCDNFVVKEKIKAEYERKEYFDNFCHKIKLMNTYDLELGYVNKEIREILIDKVEFWGEICKENPLLKKIEVKGRKLVQRIEDLHEYFMKKIKPCEEALSNFKCTFFYSSYLILTTNYIDFANSLTKKAQKVIEEKKGSIGHGMEYGLFLKINESGNKKEECLFELNITNISTSLCGLLGREKQYLLNQNITHLIPDEFQPLHCLAFDKFVRKNNFNSEESVLLGHSVDLPFKISNTHAVFLNLTATLRFDLINNSVLIECLLRKVNNSTITFIMDLNGHLVYRETEVFKDLANQPCVQNPIKNLKDQYERTKVIEKLELKTEEEENLIAVTVSPLFFNKSLEKGIKPLFKIEIQSDSFRNEKIRMYDCEAAKTKQPLSAVKSQQENDSQASNTSRKDSIENVLTILMESHSIKIEPYLTLVLFALAIIFMLYLLLLNNYLNIWDTSVSESSPTFSIINLVNMKTVFNLIIGYRYDVVQNYQNAQSEELANSLLIGQTIQQFTTAKYYELLIFQRNIFNRYVLGINNDIITKLATLLSQEVMVFSKDPHLDEQSMSMQSIIINFLVSIQRLYEGFDFDNSILQNAYLPVFYHKFTEIINSLADGLYEDMESLYRNNIIFSSLFSLLLALFIAPLWKFNVSNKKKHLKIYNLFASLEAKFIVEEIKKLEIIENEIFKYSCKNNTVESVQQVTSLFGIHIQEKQETSTKIHQNHQRFEENREKSVSILENVKIRKRGADIVVDGSDCDVKKIIIKDWIAMLFIFVFLIIMNFAFFEKLANIKKVEKHFYSALGTMKSLEQMSIGVLNSKIFFDEYNQNNRLKFAGEDLEEWTKKWIMNFENNHDYELNSSSQTITCRDKLIICKGPVSIKILLSLIKKSTSDAFEKRREYRDSSTTEAKLNLEKARIDLTMGQHALGKVASLYYNWFFATFAGLKEEQIVGQKTKTRREIFFWIFIAIFILFSIMYTIYRKKQYVKEVTLLSILNKEMLYNNKSVESFIHRLSKNLR